MVAFKSTVQKPLFSNIKVNLIVIFVIIIILIIPGIRSHILNFFGLRSHPSLKSHLTLFAERPRLQCLGLLLPLTVFVPCQLPLNFQNPVYRLLLQDSHPFH